MEKIMAITLPRPLDSNLISIHIEDSSYLREYPTASAICDAINTLNYQTHVKINNFVLVRTTYSEFDSEFYLLIEVRSQTKRMVKATLRENVDVENAISEIIDIALSNIRATASVIQTIHNGKTHTNPDDGTIKKSYELLTRITPAADFTTKLLLKQKSCTCSIL
jgi:hypothetical protein